MVVGALGANRGPAFGGPGDETHCAGMDESVRAEVSKPRSLVALSAPMPKVWCFRTLPTSFLLLGAAALVAVRYSGRVRLLAP